MPEVVGSWLLAGHGPGQPGLVPDAAEHLPDCRGGDLVAGGGDEERAPRGPNCAARGPVAGVEDLDDLIGQRQPAAAVAFGPDDVDVPGIAGRPDRSAAARVSPVRSPHECIRVKNATACHRHGDARLQPCRGGEEQLDLTPWSTGRDGRATNGAFHRSDST